MILASAYKHGKTDEEVLHAWENAVGFFDLEPDHDPPKGLCVGPDLAGNFLEVIFLETDQDDVIIHAMNLRPIFHPLLTEEQL